MKKRPAAPEPTEAQAQAALFEWLEKKYPHVYEMTTHVPNGGSRHPGEAKNLKRQGVKPGYPDILIDYPCGTYHGMRLEMKRNRRMKATAEQDNWLGRLWMHGYKAEVAYGLDHAIELIEDYLKDGYSGRRPRVAPPNED